MNKEARDLGIPVGLPVRGGGVYLMWAIEFVLICVVAMGAASIGPREPYCERCQQWTKKRHLGKIEGVDEGYLLKALQYSDLKPFLQPPPKASWKTISYNLFSCPRCSKSRYLSVTLEWDEDGNKREEPLLEYALVTKEHIAEVRNTLKEA